MSLAVGLPPGLALARPLFDPDIAVAAADPRCVHNAALAEEVVTLPRATEARQREFTAGRAAVHDAMRQLGLTPRPVLHGSDRAPVWPTGLTGSLSHTDRVCVAAVGHRQSVRALGIDIETDSSLDEALFDTVCTPAEVAALPGDDPGRRAKLLFSAKESAYKAQYELSQTLFDFQTLTVEVDPARGAFHACFTRDVGPFRRGARISGRFAVARGLIVTAVTLRR